MKTGLLFGILGVILGISGFAAWQALDSSPSPEETTAKERTADLETQLLSTRREITALKNELEIVRLSAAKDKASAAKDTDGAVDPLNEDGNDPNLETVLNDAKPLLKQLIPMFKQMRGENGQSMWMTKLIDRWDGQLELTEAQSETIQSKLLELQKTSDERFNDVLNNDEVSLAEYWKNEKGHWQNGGQIDAIMQETLDADQYAEYQRSRLEQRAQRLESSANGQLRKMNRSLDLNESQEDQIFDILVRSSGSYDPALQTDTGRIAGVIDDRDQAIREVLLPEQIPKWETYQQRNQGWERFFKK